MAKIDNNVAHALACGDNKSFGNTVVKDGAVYLHGNKIAWLNGTDLYVTHCGCFTRTTMARLNTILSYYRIKVQVRIKQHEAQLVYNDGTTAPFDDVVELLDYWY